MAVMYFAKVSMSSEIYDLYEHPEQYPEFLNKLYGAINPNLTIIDENKQSINLILLCMIITKKLLQEGIQKSIMVKSSLMIL